MHSQENRHTDPSEELEIREGVKLQATFKHVTLCQWHTYIEANYLPSSLNGHFSLSLNVTIKSHSSAQAVCASLCVSLSVCEQVLPRNLYQVSNKLWFKGNTQRMLWDDKVYSCWSIINRPSCPLLSRQTAWLRDVPYTFYFYFIASLVKMLVSCNNLTLTVTHTHMTL